MTHPFAGVRAIIFDLDGTLYADTHHFDEYARRLQAALPEQRRAAFWADYTAARGGRHTLRLGCLYDRQRDWVLLQAGGRIAEARRWTGRRVPDAAVAAAYPQPPVVDHRQLLNIGDLWWLPAACAAHLGLGPEAQWEVFLSLRDWMAGPGFQLTGLPGLGAALSSLRQRGVRCIVATNSPQPDSELLLAKAGVAGAFDRSFFSAAKPTGMAAVVGAVCADWGLVPAQVLSIGDNYVNDVAPAAAAGCRTIWIDGYGLAQAACDLRVPDLAACLPHLGQCGTGPAPPDEGPQP